MAQQKFSAHAGDCPLPRGVAQAVADYVQQATTGDQEGIIFRAWKRGANFGQLLNCQDEEVASSGPRSGLSFASGPSFAKATTSSSITTIIRPTFIRGWRWRNGH